MRFVVNDGYLLVYADVDELADGVRVDADGRREVQVLAVPIEHGTNNEQIVEPMAQGIASVLEAGWQTKSAKVRDVIAVTEHPGGAFSWLSMQRTGACEGSQHPGRDAGHGRAFHHESRRPGAAPGRVGVPGHFRRGRTSSWKCARRCWSR